MPMTPKRVASMLLAVACLAGVLAPPAGATALGAIPLLKADRIRGLAVGTLERMDTLPQLPTLSEAVVKGLEVGAWSGIMAPAGTKPDIIQKLDAAIATALKDKALLEKFAGQGVLPRYMPSAQYGAYLQDELGRWVRIVKANSVKMD